MEQSEGSSEQAECSKEQTERSEQTEIHSEQRASEQTDRAEPMAVEHAECSSKQPECSSEQPECSDEIPGCSKQTECSIDQTAPAEPTKDVEPPDEWSEPWLEVFAEQLWSLPALWRTTHAAQCKLKSGRGFAYIRLMTGMGQTEGDVKERLARATALCKEFFRLLRQKMRAVALEYLDAGPDEALRHCPAWVRRADSYLNNMPFLLTNLTIQRNEKGIPKKRVIVPLAAPTPPSSDAASVRLMRRVVRGMRRAAREHGGPTRAAAAAVATRLGDTEERVFALWCGMRKLSVFKLRALLFKGDAPSESGRLDALDWAIVDLLIMYAGITLVSEASYQNYEQLSALLGTFHLVQRFGLELPGRRGLNNKWREAAKWYSRNRVQMSVLGLQKRWCELKRDTRCRLLARLRREARAPGPLPLHQAIARRYEHVVVMKKDPHSWKWLVLQDRVARPTSERGPAPGEPDVPRTKGDDESSDSDAAAAGGDDDDDDDITIIEKTLETIDLSEDKNDETDTNEVKAPSPTPVPESTRSLPSLEAESSEKTNASREFDKSIDVNKEIVDSDAPSPKSNVLEALQGLDVGNLQTTILFDSDEEDTNNVRSVDNRASANKNKESHDKGHQRESMDSEDGNLVIDCEDSDSAIDIRNVNHDTVWREIEREMIPEPSSNWAGSSGYSHNRNIVVLAPEPKESDNDVTIDKYPLLSRMLQAKSVYDTLTTVRPKVYYNTKRYHASRAQKQYANARVVSVGKKDAKPGSERSRVSELANAAGVDEGGFELMCEVGCEADGGQESGEQQNEGTIDPKLLMYAVVVLRRIDNEIPQILSRYSTPTRTRASSRTNDAPEILSRFFTPTRTRPSSRTNDAPEILSRFFTPTRTRPSSRTNDATEILPRHSSPTRKRPSSRTNDVAEILSRQSTPPPTHPSSRVDEEPQMSAQSAPACQDLASPRESPPPPPPRPPRATIPSPRPQSLFHYNAATVLPKLVYLKRNMALLKQCKPCSVVLRRMDLGERAETVAMNRVAKKVELPDIEEVRRNNRSMLTAQVAPLAPRREGDSSPEPPSCSSDSDWTPDAERPRAAEPHPAVPDSAEPQSAEALSGESADDEAEADGWGGGATSAELGQLLTDLLAEAGCNGECSHGNKSGGRGPLTSSAESCASCALRVLSSPPISGVEARLQRRLLRRLAKPSSQPTTTVDTTAASTTATSTPATSTTVTTTTVTTIGSTTTVPTITMATERKEKSRKSRSKSARRKRVRAASPAPARARSPLDAEAAAREWLRQKNIAAEKFGLKPRSYKKQPPEPLASTSQVPPRDPPAVLKAMQATNQVPTSAQNQPLPRVNTFKIVMREVTASGLSPADRHSTQPFRITPCPANKTAQSSNSILLNQGNNSTPLLNQTNPVFCKNSAQISSALYTQKKAPQILNHTPRILNEINAPSIFNPNALAEVNKKLVTLAPTTEAEPFGFHPIISNVHSLATPKTPTLKKNDPKTQQKYIIIPASNPTGATSILVRSQESDVLRPSENVFTSPQTSLPQVVNVTGGVHLPSASVGQALHLVVSHSPQQSNAPMLTNILNQPNMVLSGNMIQNVQTQQVSVLPAMPNYLVTSMPQLVQSQPLLVSCTSVATPMIASQPSVFSSLPNRTSHAAPMVVRCVQAGPAGVSQQNVSQENSMSHHIVSQGNLSQRSPVLQNVAQHNAMLQQNVLNQHVVSQQSVSHQNHVSQQNAVSHQNPVSQQNAVSHQNPVSQQTVTSQRNLTQRSPVLQQHALLKENVAKHNAMLQQNVLNQHVVSQQSVSHQNHVSQQNAVSNQNPVSQQNAVSHQNPVSQQTVTSQRNLSQPSPVLQQHALLKENVAKHNAILQQNVLNQHVGSQQNVSHQNHVSQQNAVSHQNPVSQQNPVPHQNPVSQQKAVSHQNPVSQQKAVSQPKAVSHQNPVSQQKAVSHQNPVSQQKAVSQPKAVLHHILTQASLAQGTKVAEKSQEANKDSARPSLDWAAPVVPSHAWARGRDSTALAALCTGPRERAGWQLCGLLLVAEEELPDTRPAYWTIWPRTRLLLPGEEPSSPAKRRKLDPETPKSWLKVRAFARLAPEEVQESQTDTQKDTQKDNQKDTQKDTQKDSQDSLTAPPRVFVNNTVYQKLSDDPLVYAKLLVAVRDARACRALLARGAALQLYCLRTGKLFPLQAEAKEDVSLITLSGDEEVSGALVSLAKQLYKLADSDPQTETPVADADRQASMPEIKITVDEAPTCLEPSESEPRPAKRPRQARRAERQLAPKPPALVTSPPCRPDVVIELSDDD